MVIGFILLCQKLAAYHMDSHAFLVYSGDSHKMLVSNNPFCALKIRSVEFMSINFKTFTDYLTFFFLFFLHIHTYFSKHFHTFSDF